MPIPIQIMSIYYNHTHNHNHNQGSRSSSPPQYVSQREKLPSHQIAAAGEYPGNIGMSRVGKEFQMHKQPQLEDWQEIGNIQQAHSSVISPKKQSLKQRIMTVPRKSPPREELKNKLSFIVNYLQQQNSVAEVTHYHAGSDHQDELEQSTSTIQSNDRRKYASLPRKLQGQAKRLLLPQEAGKSRENRLVIGHKTVQNEEFALQQKPIQQSKSKPKYLFYRKVEEQRDKPQGLQHVIKPSVEGNISAMRPPFRLPGRQEAIEIVPIPDYQYVKDVHPSGEKKITRLKNKIGFIVDLFQKDDEAASVSYYSESHQSHKQSIQVKNKPPLEKKEQKQAVVQNVFEHGPRQDEEYQHEEEPKPRSKLIINTPVKKSNQFQNISIPVSPVAAIRQTPHQIPATEKIEKDSMQIIPTESALVKIKKSIKPNNSLERIELQMAQKNRNRSKSKLSATKSVENNPKPQRYDEEDEGLQNVEMRGKKKSMDERNLSRHIQRSINRQSSLPSNEFQQHISKSKSAQSKFSIKLMEMELQKSAERTPKSILDPIPISPKVVSRKKSQEKPFEDELTVKKAFPIAKKQSLPKNNPNYSKYMKINFKDSSESHDNDIADDLPSIVIKKTQQVERPRLNESPRRQTIKISSNVNTGEDTTKFSLKPVNKVQFSIDRAKRFNTEQIQQKEDLSHQEKKFLALLKKREEALLKRVKEQVMNNNPSAIIRDNIEQRSKGFSNDTFEKIVAKEESSSNKSPKNYYQAQRRDKMSLKSQQVKQSEIKSYFPTLNMSPLKNPQFQTFYNGGPLKRSHSKNVNLLASKKKGLSEPISSDSEMSKTIEDRMEDVRNIRRQPSKISYYNIKKLHKESSLNEKTFSSKEKYERLKQLLQKI